MISAIHWRGPLCVSRHADLEMAVTTFEVEFLRGSMWCEKHILIEALENWLQTVPVKWAQ